jgi:hypothetical protein
MGKEEKLRIESEKNESLGATEKKVTLEITSFIIPYTAVVVTLYSIYWQPVRRAYFLFFRFLDIETQYYLLCSTCATGGKKREENHNFL